MNWQPSASETVIHQRARLLSVLRQFFLERGITEIETPLLAQSGITDPSIEPMLVSTTDGSSRFLQTSPEYAMKRMLAAYNAPIYQVSRVFRAGEAGPRHNPEFTLLEWYRPGFDYHRLMDEVAQLVTQCLGQHTVNRITYRDLFLQQLQLDPFTAELSELEAVSRSHCDVGTMEGDRDLWLDLLMSHLLEPRLAELGLCFVYDYPASQAALSNTVEDEGVQVGQRFELYVDGMELANGYCELTDANEQRRRFDQDNLCRLERGQPQRALDQYLLAAMEHGLPACSGVALGVDRLLMLVCGVSDIREVLAFDWARA